MQRCLGKAGELSSGFTVEVHLWLVWERMGVGVEEGDLDKGKKSIVENQGPAAG